MFKAITQSSTDAVKGAQTMMNLIDPTLKLRVDGVIGGETLAAYKQTPVEGKTLIREMTKGRNSSVVDALKNGLVPVKTVAAGNWISLDECRKLVRRAVSQYGSLAGTNVSAEEYLEWLLNLEPSSKTVDGVVYYNASSVSGSFRGLYQVGPSAWKDVSRSNRVSGLPEQAVGAFDPWWNTAVALVYSQLLVGYLRTGSRANGVAPYKGPITREILYGAHNQGAVGLLTGAKNALVDRNQSAKAIVVIAKAVSQLTTA